jgi:hypothetical protein
LGTGSSPTTTSARKPPDEISELISGSGIYSTIFSNDLNSLSNIYARNNAVAVKLMSQELHQFPVPRIQHNLMSCGNLILGSTSNKDVNDLWSNDHDHYQPLAAIRLV